jgi:hypothetical protein
MKIGKASFALVDPSERISFHGGHHRHRGLLVLALECSIACSAAIPCNPLLFPCNSAARSAVKAYLYEPQVDRTYARMAAHYDTAILPARPRLPRDKAKVELAVLTSSDCCSATPLALLLSLAELNLPIGTN